MTIKSGLVFGLHFGLGLVLLGCGDGKGSTQTIGDAGEAGVEEMPLALASLTGCAADVDCTKGRFCFQSTCRFECEATSDCGSGESCSERGRCVIPTASAPSATDGVPVLKEYEPSVSVESGPNSTYLVAAGQKVVVLSFVLSGALPEAGLAYTVKRSDEAQNARVYRVKGAGTKIEIPLPVGLADPALGAKATTVTTTVATALGAYHVTLVPAPPVAGHYSGTVTLQTFGQTGLPIDFQIVTQPENVPLEKADHLWLVLPTAKASLFSPVEAFPGAPGNVAAPLTYDAFLGRWVAKTSYEYRLGQQSLLTTGPGQISRILRFELEMQNGQVIGALSDRWQGFYEARSLENVVDFVDVVFEGKFELSWVEPGLPLSKLPQPLAFDLPTRFPLSAPPIDKCAATVKFPTAPVVVDGVEYTCGSIATAAAFILASPEQQASCAMASAGAALNGVTTGQLLASFLDENAQKPSNKSFAEFMEACAKGTDGNCEPAPAILCSRQLLALAFHNQAKADVVTDPLVVTYQKVTTEAFLGRQLAALKNDTDTRLTWLKTTDYPAIVTNAVRDLVAGLLEDWRLNVLEKQQAVLRGYFDPSGLAVISRSTTAAAADPRRRLLSQMIQGWRGSMDSLITGTTRWNELFQDATKRAEKSQYVRAAMLDLYLMAGIVTNLSKDAGTGYQASAFGSGFSELMRAVNKLDRTFDELVFARDAEVVVSKSLDETSTNETILANLQKGALAKIKEAADSVQTVIATAQAEALGETQLQNRMSNEVDELRDDLAGLCGLPIGCTSETFRTDAACAVQSAAGKCGFSIEKGTGNYQAFSVGQQSVSEAGRSLLSIQDANQAVAIAEEDLRAHGAKMDLEYATLKAQAENVEKWNNMRLAQNRALETLLSGLNDIQQAGYGDLLSTLSDKSAKRTEQIDRMTANLEKWNGLRIDGNSSDLAKQREAAGMREAGSALATVAEGATDIGNAAAECAGLDVGRCMAMLTAALISGIARAGSIAANAAAANVEVSLANDQATRSARLENLQETAARDDALTEADIAKIEDFYQQAQADRDAKAGDLKDAYDKAKAARDAELAYFRDKEELEGRRTKYLQNLQDHAGLQVRVDRAKLGVVKTYADYLGIVQRAGLMDAKLKDLQAQRTDINQIVGSPTAVFARTNRITQAEEQLQQTKNTLMDWLVALEYFAVKPFMD
jgi:hypothetical protein